VTTGKISSRGESKTLGIDLTDTEIFVSGNPHDMWKRLRAEAPVYFNPTDEGGFWALTTFEDVLAAFRNPKVFSSAHGPALGGSYRSTVDSSSGRMLISSDSPQHGLLRRRMQRVFTTSMIAKIRSQVRARVAEALVALEAAGGGDFVTAVAQELPAGALMAMFAIDHDAALELLRLTRAMIEFRDQDYLSEGVDNALRLASAQADVFDFFLDLVAERRKAPGKDAVSILVGARSGERPLDEDTVLFNLMNLAVGGNETTPHTAAGGALALMEAPDQLDRLRANEHAVSTAVEEMLRWTSANAYVQRVVTKTVEIRGVELRTGDLVTLWNASANRDERKFANADCFDVLRTPNHHLAFGSGAHHCIGAITARAELVEFVSALRAMRWRLVAAGRPERLHSNFMLGITRLPVEVAG
jgi:cytochrome P450